MSFFLFICLSVCPFVCLSTCLPYKVAPGTTSAHYVQLSKERRTPGWGLWFGRVGGSYFQSVRQSSDSLVPTGDLIVRCDELALLESGASRMTNDDLYFSIQNITLILLQRINQSAARVEAPELTGEVLLSSCSPGSDWMRVSTIPCGPIGSEANENQTNSYSFISFQRRPVIRSYYTLHSRVSCSVSRGLWPGVTTLRRVSHLGMKK